MPKYDYVALDQKGAETKGSIAALATKERLRLEVEAVDLLKKAIKANRASGLMGAMNRVADLSKLAS